jgi:hypothetical protein
MWLRLWLFNGPSTIPDLRLNFATGVEFRGNSRDTCRVKLALAVYSYLLVLLLNNLKSPTA